MHTPETRARAYQKMRRLRADWLAANGPCKRCGSWGRLEVDHIDENKKLRPGDHGVWSWSARRREIELSKCQVLCHWCHSDKTTLRMLAPLVHGAAAYKSSRCRCGVCLGAKREAQKKWRQRKAAVA